MNLRLRTLKCYLRWLYTEKIIFEDISTKIKLVKVLKDTKETLTTAEIKPIFKVLNLDEYSNYIDFVIMLAMLDFGLRINTLNVINNFEKYRKKAGITMIRFTNYCC